MEEVLFRFLRHGQSEANAGLPTDDHATIALTELGHAQARDYASGCQAPPQRLIVSPFLRAQQTAAPLIERFNLAPETWPIQEFTYLSPQRCVGTTHEQRRARVAEYWQHADPDQIDGPGAESFHQLIERADRLLTDLQALDASGQVLLVGHGHLMKAVRWRVNGGALRVTSEQMRRFRQREYTPSIPNCQGFDVLRTDGRWVMQSLAITGGPESK